jgi:hypothetical protein
VTELHGLRLRPGGGGKYARKKFVCLHLSCSVLEIQDEGSRTERFL